MVWIYDSPLTRKERKAYIVLKNRLKKHDLAKETVKIIGLISYLRSTKFSSPSEIRESVYFDNEKTRPIFTEKVAKEIFRALKQKGGESKYPFIDFTVKNNISELVSYLPEVVEIPLRNIYSLLITPVSNLKENVPLIELALDAIHGATETGVTTAEDASEAIGGPIGAAAVTPFVALVAATVSTIAMLEDDVGQGVAHILNALPLFGSSIGKGITQTEHMVKSLEKHPYVASYIPLVNTYVLSKTAPPAGGKRFSTQKHKYKKWRRTQRAKSAKV